MRVYLRDGQQFDFDSLEPVQGEAFAKPTGIFLIVLDYLAAFDVILLGAWVCQWWYDSGWVKMRVFFADHAAWVLRMAEFGQL